MNGILVIDKPAGMTSHDVVDRVRRILKTKRVGHTGTLDPFATGVLVVLVGKATRLAQFLASDVKEYVAEVKFGHETDTGDVTGAPKALASSPISISKSQLETALNNFLGEINQTPPMFSAKKVAGKKLYELARAGKEVDRAPVAVTIYELTIIDHTRLLSDAVVCLRVRCSAGTYIRTLAEDVAKVAGSAAHLASLRRTAAGQFDLGQSCTIEELEQMSEPAGALAPVDLAVRHLTEFVLVDDRIDKTKSGLSTRTSETRFNDGDVVRMTGNGGEVIAVGVYDAAEKCVRPKIVLV